MELNISVLSKSGGRSVNEDAYGCWSHQGRSFCVLSDGAGGHNGGEVASKLAVQHVLEWFRQSPDCGPDGIAASLRAANDAIVAAQLGSPHLAEMRATIAVLVVDSERRTATWGHVGDTRLYCLRQQRIILQTKDHSVLQSMIDAGYMKSQDLRKAPQRNMLLAALGDTKTFTPTIQSRGFEIADGDIFLLCTDGFWEYVDEAQMERSLNEADSPETWLRRMESQVAAHGSEGQDNYSALVVACTARDDFN
ncbi:PP2C family protein-serine/threonine phosphatase [Pseudoduganella sp. OTU4001]|uniref:PP2C family protein-serine/threonine phosphatase n=1 Tax=Pseudoduganella sp. OTU4001 TaxID=3043854 RepID=UPI00313A87C5